MSLAEMSTEEVRKIVLRFGAYAEEVADCRSIFVPLHAIEFNGGAASVESAGVHAGDPVQLRGPAPRSLSR